MWLTQDMEVHLPSSCAAASSDLTVCGFYSLILLLIPLLLIISRWQFNSLTRPMAGNCWPDSAWSIIVHLLIHIHHSLTHYLTASSSSLSVNWVVLSGLSSSSFPGPGKVLTWVHYFYAIHRLRIVRIRILLSWTTHSSQLARCAQHIELKVVLAMEKSNKTSQSHKIAKERAQGI